jgi:adenosylcobinamide kinase/adenosylcobinamide-phosphate guanylyltransferase
MGKITFILGGARSGKSTYALALAGKKKKVAFIATCQARDKEMSNRIKLHKKSRPIHWETFEEPHAPSVLLEKKGNTFEIILIDCLTLLISNLMLKGTKEKEIKLEIYRLLNLLKKTKAESIIVSNEVGLGIVPDNRLARDFRDIAGKINQVVAEESDRVFFMVSGMPMQVKGR